MWQIVHLKQCYMLSATLEQRSAWWSSVRSLYPGSESPVPSPRDAQGSQHPCFGVESWWARVIAAAIQNLRIALPVSSTDSHVIHMWQMVHLKQCYMLSAILEKRSVWRGQVVRSLCPGSESPAHDIGTITKRGDTLWGRPVYLALQIEIASRPIMATKSS